MNMKAITFLMFAVYLNIYLVTEYFYIYYNKMNIKGGDLSYLYEAAVLT